MHPGDSLRSGEAHICSPHPEQKWASQPTPPSLWGCHGPHERTLRSGLHAESRATLSKLAEAREKTSAVCPRKDKLRLYRLLSSWGRGLL